MEADVWRNSKNWAKKCLLFYQHLSTEIKKGLLFGITCCMCSQIQCIRPGWISHSSRLLDYSAYNFPLPLACDAIHFMYIRRRIRRKTYQNWAAPNGSCPSQIHISKKPEPLLCSFAATLFRSSVLLLISETLSRLPVAQTETLFWFESRILFFKRRTFPMLPSI